MTMTARLAASPWRLVAAAAGPAHGWPGKTGRLAALLRAYGSGEHRVRLGRLQRLGLIERVPADPQLVAGAADMLRFWISPAAADYYAQRGISYGFHQVLRLLDEPASLGDPLGLFSTEDGIIGHVMQVVHANPRYDLELLSMFEGGVANLEAQLALMLAGTHPRAQAIGAIVEEADYHARLLDYVRRFRRDPHTTPPLRANIAGGFDALEATFGSLGPAMRYAATLPTDWAGALTHLRTTPRFVPRG